MLGRIFALIVLSSCLLPSRSLAQSTSMQAVQQQQAVAALADPSALTTQQLYREVLNLKENLAIRLDAMDKAIQLTQQYPTLLDKVSVDLKARTDAAIAALHDLVDQRFALIDTQIKERDIRVEQRAGDTKVALDAALSAADKGVTKQQDPQAEAAAKQEAAFTKQIDQIITLFNARAQTNADRIDEIRLRLSALDVRALQTADAMASVESLSQRIQAIESQKQGSSDTYAWIFAVAGFLAATLSIIGAIAVVIWHRPVAEPARVVLRRTES